jgi:hypothetical protein
MTTCCISSKSVHARRAGLPAPAASGAYIGVRGGLYTIVAGFSTLPNFALRMVFSDLPSPAEAGFAKAGNR